MLTIMERNLEAALRILPGTKICTHRTSWVMSSGLLSERKRERGRESKSGSGRVLRPARYMETCGTVR